MATEKLLHCSVITPERKVLEAEATSVVIPAHDGEIGILFNRAPLLCELGRGSLRLDSPGEGVKRLRIEGGFAQVLVNEVTVLTEKAADA